MQVSHVNYMSHLLGVRLGTSEIHILPLSCLVRLLHSCRFSVVVCFGVVDSQTKAYGMQRRRKRLQGLRKNKAFGGSHRFCSSTLWGGVLS